MTVARSPNKGNVARTRSWLHGVLRAHGPMTFPALREHVEENTPYQYGYEALRRHWNWLLFNGLLARTGYDPIRIDVGEYMAVGVLHIEEAEAMDVRPHCP